MDYQRENEGDSQYQGNCTIAYIILTLTSLHKMNITSLGGRISFPLNSPYHATKFALEGLSESIQYELES